jgi:hypothetical protein
VIDVAWRARRLRPRPYSLFGELIQACWAFNREVLGCSRRRHQRDGRMVRRRRRSRHRPRRPRKLPLTLACVVAKRVAIDSLPLPAATTNDALQAAICRLTPLLATRDFRLLRQPFTATACFRHSHERVLRRPSLIDTRQAAPSDQCACTRCPCGARAGDLALRWEM